MTTKEQKLLEALKDIIESYDLSKDHFDKINPMISGCLRGFFITIYKHKKLVKDLECN